MLTWPEIVRLAVVLLAAVTSLPAGTAGLSARISPEHLHAAPGGEVTFTCEADEPVSGCEFRVRLGDSDLPLVDALRSAEGSWLVPSTVTWKTKGRGEGGRASARREQDQSPGPAWGQVRPRRNTATRSSDGARTDFQESRAANSQRPQRRTGSADRHVLSTTAPPTPRQSQVDASTTNASDDELDQPEEVVGHRSLVVLQGGGASEGGVARAPPRGPSPYIDDTPQTWQAGRAQNRHVKRPGGGKGQRGPSSLPPRVGADVAPGYRWLVAPARAGRACTLTLPEARQGRHLIGCRVRQQDGVWHYALASLDVNGYRALGMTAEAPPLGSARLGSAVSVTCRSSTSMTSCNVGGARGSVTSFEECRGNVRSSAGPVWCKGVGGATHQEAVAVFLTVDSPPATAELLLSPSEGPFIEGQLLTATCAVGSAQPTANVTWKLGDEVLRADDEDDFPSDEWAWPWEGRGLKQSVHLTLSSFDDDLELACHVTHPARSLKRSSLIRVTPDSEDGVADCGQMPEVKVGSRIQGGVVAKNTPWAVGVYRKQRDGEMLQVCGGTLVSRRLVVSSAQCFWDATFSRVADASLFRVALGKRRRDWLPAERLEQTPGIARIAIPKFFLGRRGAFANDVAVVVLDTPVTLSERVGVVCLDRENQLGELRPGQSGLVAGWGVTEWGQSSSRLRALQLPFVPFRECARAVDKELQRFLSYDKFCAGFRNESKSVCPGDSGGGLVFKDEDSGRHFLRGVASIAFAPIGNEDSCYADLYTGFTRVSEYASWIFKQAPAPVTAA